MDALTGEGLGLAFDDLRLARTTDGWVAAGSQLRDEVEALLGDDASAVAQIGSSAVVGLLAKPIVDLAVGLSADQEVAPVRRRLEAAGWIHRGDAGERGGHVFVLEARPWFRVAHLHVVPHDGRQWTEYVCLRDHLRRSSAARTRYEAVKVQLVEQHGTDREAYTDAKTEVVRALLAEAAQPERW